MNFHLSGQIMSSAVYPWAALPRSVLHCAVGSAFVRRSAFPAHLTCGNLSGFSESAAYLRQATCSARRSGRKPSWSPGCKPSLYLGWSDRDWFRDENRSFAQKAAELGYNVQAAESAGLHNWDFWKRSLGPALDWASMTA